MQQARALLLFSAMMCGGVADISDRTATTFASSMYSLTNITTPTATIVPGGTTTVDDRSAATPAGLICYDDRTPALCSGIDRGLAVEAIDWFCGVFHDHVFDFPYNNVGGTYFYIASSWATEPKDGKIRITIDLIEDRCAPVVAMSQEACREWFRIPIDQCDIEGTSNKHGGYIDHGCLRYQFEPCA